jgi:hypothetical protein
MTSTSIQHHKEMHLTADRFVCILQLTDAFGGSVGAIDGLFVIVSDYHSGHYGFEAFGLNVQAAFNNRIQLTYMPVAGTDHTNDNRSLCRFQQRRQWLDNLTTQCILLVKMPSLSYIP